jgi:hypothetical protein
MSLTDLLKLKSIIEERLAKQKAWLDGGRGFDYTEYCRRETIYENDENHSRLKIINQRIEEFVNSVK